MATYHLTLKVGAKGRATPHFNYICATKKYAAKRGVVHIEHGNMPVWAMANPSLFWKASDEFERANGTVYRELEVSLPRELPLDQQVSLANQLAKESCGNNHAFSFAIHHAKASDGGMNPHVHLQFSERIDDGHERDPKHYFKRANKTEPEKGGCIKDRSWQASKRGKQKVAESSDHLLEVRKAWEVMCNQALEKYGSDARIDHRSNKARGIKTAPQPKVGAKSWHLHQRTGEKNERYNRWEQVIASNNAIITTVANKPSQFDRYQDAQHDLKIANRKLSALEAIPQPNKAMIIKDMAEGHKSVIQLDDEVWQLEHVTQHKAYDKMKQSEWKRDTGNNMFMRAWNKFYYGGHYNRHTWEYEGVLQLKADKTKQHKSLVQKLSQKLQIISRANDTYDVQQKAYYDYHQRKGELELDIQSAERLVSAYASKLPTSAPVQEKTFTYR